MGLAAVQEGGTGNRARISRGSLANFSLARFSLASFSLPVHTSMATACSQVTAFRAGRILTKSGQLAAVQARWWPYRGNLWTGYWEARQRSDKFREVAIKQVEGPKVDGPASMGSSQDWCELFYHQPWSSRDFISLAYVRAGLTTSISTLYLAAAALDQIARLKNSSAIVCHVTNDRISDRLLERWGWHRHCLHWSGRHFIKRFYGQYPEYELIWRQRLGLE